MPRDVISEQNARMLEKAPVLANCTSSVGYLSATRENQQKVRGTAFVVEWQGEKLLFTARHCVDDAEKVVFYPNQRSAEPITIENRLLAKNIDFALLIPKKGLSTERLNALPALSLGNDMSADMAYVLGYPQNERDKSEKRGLIYPVLNQRELTAYRTFRKNRDAITTYRAGVTYKRPPMPGSYVPQGMSGGPYVDENGRVVGVNSAGTKNTARAVSIETIKAFLQMHLDGARRPAPQTQSRHCELMF